MVQHKDFKVIDFPKKFKYISCYGSTIRFNDRELSAIEFKYISCYGSTQ